MKIINFREEILERTKILVDEVYALDRQSDMDYFCSLSASIDRLIYLLNYAGLSSSDEKKLSDFRKILRDLHKITADLLLCLSAAQLLSGEMLPDAGQRESAARKKLEKHLRQRSLSLRKTLQKKVKAEMSRMDESRYLKALTAAELQDDAEPDRQRNTMRKKYLKALLPLQIFNADGQQSRSVNTFQTLYESVGEVLFTAAAVLPEEEKESLENLKALRISLGKILAIDAVIAETLGMLDEKRREFSEFIQKACENDQTDWGAASESLPSFSPRSWFAVLRAGQELRKSEISGFLRVWEEIVYRKTWFILFNQSYN